jgi:predicted DNA-binding antitoxin AbrB/MazE fold protein
VPQELISGQPSLAEKADKHIPPKAPEGETAVPRRPEKNTASAPVSQAEVLREMAPQIMRKIIELAYDKGDTRAAALVLKLAEKVEIDDGSDGELKRMRKRLSAFEKNIVGEIVSLLAEADERAKSVVGGMEPAK